MRAELDVEAQVAVPGLLEHAHTVMEAVHLARAHYRQEAIYVSYLGAAEIISG